jgi:hypothetical protein
MRIALNLALFCTAIMASTVARAEYQDLAPLVEKLHRAANDNERLAMIKTLPVVTIDRPLLSRLTAGARRTLLRVEGQPLLYTTAESAGDDIDPSPLTLSSSNPDVYIALQLPAQLTKDAELAFIIRGGRPGVVDLGQTGGSQILFRLNAKGELTFQEVQGRGDLLIKYLSVQLTRDLAKEYVLDDLADPEDLLVLLDRVAPALLEQMIRDPKPAVLFRPILQAVPFAREEPHKSE